MLDWQDGLPYSNRFGDVYFSADSGLEETRHVFLSGNQLPDRFSALSAGESLCVGETGFGTGLNFLCTWRLFELHAPAATGMDFFSVEKYPLDDAELSAALALWPELVEFSDALLGCWRRRVPGWNRWTLAEGRVRLTLVVTDVSEALTELSESSVDAWFLDGFAPSRNPEMWSSTVMSLLARTSRPGATFATYTSAGWVRRGLLEAGFSVQKVPGFGRKREMLVGQRAGQGGVSGRQPQTAMVVGGGVAGCAAAFALARRGLQVTLVEQSGQLAEGASGNPRGILHARYGAGMNPLHQFVLASYGHALSILDAVLPVDGQLRGECGVLQLAFSDNEQQRITRLTQRDWPVSVFERVDAIQAAALSGVPVQHGGLWFPAGGWLVPAELCRRMTHQPGISLQKGLRVDSVVPGKDGWEVAGHDARGQGWRHCADLVVVANAHQARQLAPFAHLSLTPVRGQVTVIQASADSGVLRTVVCADGYCSPAVAGEHVLGATHAFGDEGRDVRQADHAENLAKIAEQIPNLRLDEAAVLSGRASVRCSAPGAMPLVGAIAPGLYCSLAHGTRGLLTAGLAGELIASQAMHTLLPLPVSVVAALDPQRPGAGKLRADVPEAGAAPSRCRPSP